jgi:hypothetical protein
VVIPVAAPIGWGTVWAGLVQQSELRRESMKLILRAAIAVFSLGIGTAYAGDGDGNSATTLFTSIQNKQAAPALISVAAQLPTIAARNVDAAVQGPDTRSQGPGAWSFRVFSLP